MTHEQTLGSDAPVAEMAGLWRRVLGRQDVPLDATFPELGGDSLLLISLLTMIENELEVYLEAEDILDDLTVPGMAQAVLKARKSA